jgi:dCMP deaminase
MNSENIAEELQKQYKYDCAYLRMATEWAKLSHCKRRQVGAIIVKNNIIIADGFNGTPSGFENCCEDQTGNTHWYVLHAEANAILKLAKSNNRGQNSTLYVTLSPCKDCSKLILQAGVKRVVFIKKYKDSSGIDFLSKAGIEVAQIKNPFEKDER